MYVYVCAVGGVIQMAVTSLRVCFVCSLLSPVIMHCLSWFTQALLRGGFSFHLRD